MPERVILDCDTKNEVDDQFAIAHALGTPRTLEVLGVVSVHNTTAHGPASRDLYQREAEQVVGLCAGNTPCLPGAPYPMEDARTPVDSEGLEFIARAARQAPLTLICTGPATDAASLLLKYPELTPNLRVVWLGGFGDRYSYEQYKMGGELNGRADIAAWRALFASEVELLQVPGWSGPHRIVVESEAFAQKLRGLGRPVADYLARILEEWVAGYEGPLDPQGTKIIWDIACIAAVADPESVSVKLLDLPSLDAAGAHDFEARGRRVQAVTDLEPERILNGLMEALARHPQRL